MNCFLAPFLFVPFGWVAVLQSFISNTICDTIHHDPITIQPNNNPILLGRHIQPNIRRGGKSLASMRPPDEEEDDDDDSDSDDDDLDDAAEPTYGGSGSGKQLRVMGGARGGGKQLRPAQQEGAYFYVFNCVWLCGVLDWIVLFF